MLLSFQSSCARGRALATITAAAAAAVLTFAVVWVLALVLVIFFLSQLPQILLARFIPIVTSHIINQLTASLCVPDLEVVR